MSTESREKFRDRLIEIASEKFGKFGYKKTSLDDIALATRKGKTSIYYYFKNKEDIFKAVVEKEAQTLSDKMLIALSKANGPEEKLKAYIFTRMEALKGVSNFYDALKNELYDQLNFIDAVREKYLHQEIELIRLILEEGKQKGIFKISDTALTAITIVNILKGLEIPLFAKEEPVDLEARINAFLHILFVGLKKR